MLFKKKQPDPIKCDHIYNNYVRMTDVRRMCITMYLKCYKCGDTIEFNVTDGLLSDLFRDIGEHGIHGRN